MFMRFSIALALSAIVLVCQQSDGATTKTWTGAVSTDWATSGNWSPSGAPGSYDTAQFNASATRDCVIGSSKTVAYVVIGGAFDKDISISSGTLTVNNDFTQSVRTFSAGSGNFTVKGNLALSGGTFNAGSGSDYIEGNFSFTGGTFNCGTSTLEFKGSKNSTISGGPSFYNLNINKGSGYSVTVSASVTVNNLFKLEKGTYYTGGYAHDFLGNFTTLSSTTFDAGSGTHSFHGNVSVSSSGTITCGTSTLNIDGNQAQTVGLEGKTVNNLTVNNITDYVTFSKAYTASGTVAFEPGSKIKFQASTTFTLANIDWQGTDVSDVTIESTNSSYSWNLVVTDNQTVAYVDVQRSNASGGDQILATLSTNSGNNTNWYFRPVIDRSPISFSFHALHGGDSPSPDILQISNGHYQGNALNWSVSDDAEWLTLDPPSGSATTETDEVTVTVDSQGLTADTYNATITISDSNASNNPQTVSVELVVEEPHSLNYDVGTGKEFSTPQAAMDALVENAEEYGSIPEDSFINIYSGEYTCGAGAAVVSVPCNSIDFNSMKITVQAMEAGVIFTIPSDGFGVKAVSGGTGVLLDVEGIALEGSSGTGIKIESPGTYAISEMTFDNLDYGVLFAGGLGGADTNISASDFVSCDIGVKGDNNFTGETSITSCTADLCGSLLYAFCGPWGSLTDCTITNSTGTAIYVTQCNWDITDNTITGGAGTAIALGVYGTSSILRNNISENSGSGIYSMGLADGVEVGYNRLINNGWAFAGTGGVHHNVVSTECGNGIYLMGGTANFNYVFTNNTIHVRNGGLVDWGGSTSYPWFCNNIMIATGDQSYVYHNLAYLGSDYNCYVMREGAKFMLWSSDVPPPGEYTLEEWQAASTNDQNSFSAEPLFVDEPAYDYHLRSAAVEGTYNDETDSWQQYAQHSPCIDAGDNSSYSLEPAPNGSVINLGAYGGTEHASKSTGQVNPSDPPAPVIAAVNVFENTSNDQLALDGGKYYTNENTLRIDVQVTQAGGATVEAVSVDGVVANAIGNDWYEAIVSYVEGEHTVWLNAINNYNGTAVSSIIIVVDLTPPTINIQTLTNTGVSADVHNPNPTELGFFFFGPIVAASERGADALGGSYTIDLLAEDAGSFVTKLYCVRVTNAAEYPADITYPFYKYKDNVSYYDVFADDPLTVGTVQGPVGVGPAPSINYSITPDAVSSGTTNVYVYTVVAEDRVGNIGQSYQTVFVKKDLEYPVLSKPGITSTILSCWYPLSLTSNNAFEKDVVSVKVKASGDSTFVEALRSTSDSNMWFVPCTFSTSFSGVDMIVRDYAGNLNTGGEASFIEVIDNCSLWVESNKLTYMVNDAQIQYGGYLSRNANIHPINLTMWTWINGLRYRCDDLRVFPSVWTYIPSPSGGWLTGTQVSHIWTTQTQEFWEYTSQALPWDSYLLDSIYCGIMDPRLKIDMDATPTNLVLPPPGSTTNNDLKFTMDVSGVPYYCISDFEFGGGRYWLDYVEGSQATMSYSAGSGCLTFSRTALLNDTYKAGIHQFAFEGSHLGGYYGDPSSYSYWQYEQPRSLPVLEVTPSVIIMGRTQTVYIRGWFIKSDGTYLVPGNTASVTFFKDNPLYETTVTGTVMEDDPFNATCVKAIKCVVTIPAVPEGQSPPSGWQDVELSYNPVITLTGQYKAIVAKFGPVYSGSWKETAEKAYVLHNWDEESLHNGPDNGKPDWNETQAPDIPLFMNDRNLLQFKMKLEGELAPSQKVYLRIAMHNGVRVWTSQKKEAVGGVTRYQNGDAIEFAPVGTEKYFYVEGKGPGSLAGLDQYVDFKLQTWSEQDNSYGKFITPFLTAYIVTPQITSSETIDIASGTTSTTPLNNLVLGYDKVKVYYSVNPADYNVEGATARLDISYKLGTDYKLVYRATGLEIGSGKVVEWDGKANCDEYGQSITPVYVDPTKGPYYAQIWLNQSLAGCSSNEFAITVNACALAVYGGDYTHEYVNDFVQIQGYLDSDLGYYHTPGHSNPITAALAADLTNNNKPMIWYAFCHGHVPDCSLIALEGASTMRPSNLLPDRLHCQLAFMNCCFSAAHEPTYSQWWTKFGAGAYMGWDALTETTKSDGTLAGISAPVARLFFYYLTVDGHTIQEAKVHAVNDTATIIDNQELRLLGDGSLVLDLKR